MRDRIAILGGTFNPPHNGHLSLAKGIAEKISVKKVLLIPSYEPPHKTAEYLAPPEHRLKMCELIAEEDPLYEVLDLELVRGGKSYTLETVRQLRKQNRDTDYFFICGADMFLTVDSWYGYGELVKQVVFCTAPRGQSDYEKLIEKSLQIEKDGGESVVCDFPLMDISSTQIRNMLKLGRSVRGLLPQKVADYIERNGLYTQLNSKICE